MKYTTESPRNFAAFVSLLVVMAVLTALMVAVRIYLVEPEPLAQRCVVDQSGWRCVVRAAAVYGFLHNVFGWAALLCGILATVSRWRWLAFCALACGIAGAVLYKFELSGVGLLLGMLVWVQRPPLHDEQNGREGEAHGAPTHRADI